MMQVKCANGEWIDIGNIGSGGFIEYREKPEKKPDVVKYVGLIDDDISNPSYRANRREVIDHWPIQLKLTFCGETGKLLRAEVL